LTDREQFKRNAKYSLETASLNGAVDKEPIIIHAHEVVPASVEWLWYGILARGKISLLEGDPDLGKSTLTIEIAARLSRGQALPGAEPLPPVGTLFLSAEDGVADTIVPRLIAAGADLERIKILDGVRVREGEEGVATIPSDLDAIENALTAQRCALVIVDPLSVFLDDGINENHNQQVRKAMTPAMHMLERANAAGWMLRHWTKAQSVNAIYRGAGSIGLGGAARVVMMVAKDPEQPGVHVLARSKGNLTPPIPSRNFRLIGSPDNPQVATVTWAGLSDWQADDLQGQESMEESGKLADAKIWLADYLRGGVIVQANLVQRDGRKDGHQERTLDRAKKVLGVRSIKNVVDNHWGWQLPEAPLP
jgi:hypothetical protein